MVVMESQQTEQEEKIIMNDLLRNTLNQLTLGAVEKVAPEAIGALMGLPPGTTTGVVAVSTMLLKGTAQTAVLKTYDDIRQRQISSLETSKVEYSFQKAENVFWEHVEKEGAENAGYSFDVYSPVYRIFSNGFTTLDARSSQ